MSHSCTARHRCPASVALSIPSLAPWRSKSTTSAELRCGKGPGQEAAGVALNNADHQLSMLVMTALADETYLQLPPVVSTGRFNGLPPSVHPSSKCPVAARQVTFPPALVPTHWPLRQAFTGTLKHKLSSSCRWCLLHPYPFIIHSLAAATGLHQRATA